MNSNLVIDQSNASSKCLHQNMKADISNTFDPSISSSGKSSIASQCNTHWQRIEENLARCEGAFRSNLINPTHYYEWKSKILAEMNTMNNRYFLQATERVPKRKLDENTSMPGNNANSESAHHEVEMKKIEFPITNPHDPFAALHVLQEVSTNATLKNLYGLRSPKLKDRERLPVNEKPHVHAPILPLSKVVPFVHSQAIPLFERKNENVPCSESHQQLAKGLSKRFLTKSGGQKYSAEKNTPKKRFGLSKDGSKRRGRTNRTTHSLKSKLEVIQIYDDTVHSRGGKDRGVKRFVANLLNLSETMIGRWINERHRIKAAYEKALAEGKVHKNCVTKR